MQSAAVEVRNVSKTFGSVEVLHNVLLSVARGEARGLVGRNGAGKSTLVSILTGLLPPTKGTVFFDGVQAPAERTSQDWRSKVACVYQRSTLVPTLSVAENLFINSHPGKRDWIDWADLRAKARMICEEWELAVDVETRASDLRVEQRQIVEIARALLKGARFIIFDEPTAALESREVARLFERIQRLKRDGVTLLYISHHLQEIYDICDSVTVLRDGRVIVPDAPVADFPKPKIVEAMVGEHIVQSSRLIPSPEKTSPVLSVDNLTLPGVFEQVSFDLFPGEQVGLAGLGGSGKEQIAESIAGLVTPAFGHVRIAGASLAFGDVPTAQRLGVTYVPRDRRGRGIVPLLSIAENLTLTIQRSLGRGGWISPRKMRLAAKRLYDALSVVASSPQQAVIELSGGNQQKVVMGRALASSPRILLLVYPTQGVDIASKEAIFDIVASAQQRGTAALVVSDELDELRNCNRILVVFKGRVVREFDADWNERDLIAAIEGVDT